MSSVFDANIIIIIIIGQHAECPYYVKFNSVLTCTMFGAQHSKGNEKSLETKETNEILEKIKGDFSEYVKFEVISVNWHFALRVSNNNDTYQCSMAHYV